MTSITRCNGMVALALCASVATAACSKDTGRAETKAPDLSAAAGQAPAGDQAAGGRTIVVEAYTDAAGNYFKPNEIEAKKGDVIRFTLKMGVHNVHFLPDSNPGKTGLPAASDMLQLPGQTYDVPVTQASGRYYFQCDPHALLGMKGHLTVKE